MQKEKADEAEAQRKAMQQNLDMAQREEDLKENEKKLQEMEQRLQQRKREADAAAPTSDSKV